MKRIGLLSVVGAVSLAVAGCAHDSSSKRASSAMDEAEARGDWEEPMEASREWAGPEMDIVDTAATAGEFNTLVAAVKAAGLVDTLKGPGPFTVFAPTDEAFAKLPPGTLEELLKPENREKLQAILTYHVVPGEVMAAEASQVDSARTVQGSSVAIRSSGGKVWVDEASVIKTDIKAQNGVIHVIDRVILPKS